MNVFFIPSWYPSHTEALPGIFFRDQALAMARTYPDINIGISTWGQNDDRLLLWSGKLLKSMKKLFGAKPDAYAKSIFQDRVMEYFTPTYTWTHRWLDGNMDDITQTNKIHLAEFEKKFGKVDIIHAHVGFPAGHIAKVLSQEKDIPYVITEQMSPFPHKYYETGRQNILLMEAYHHSSKNISISKPQASQMEKLGVDDLTIIPNLVDESFFVPAIKPLANKKLTFFSLGRLEPQKGMDILLEAFSSIDGPAQLRIGGDGSFRKQYAKQADSLDISSRVQFLGELDKSQALSEFQACDAFVLASRHESMGVVFAEAMAVGKPMIGTICGGPEDFINETNGYLVAPEDAQGLRQAMEKMMISHQQFDSKSIRNYFMDRFSSKSVCTQIMDVYNQVVEIS